MFKKFIAALGAAVLSVSLFSSCSSTAVKDNDRLSVVCTVFPCYDWARQIIGDSQNTELTYLLGNGSDLHNFQPTADDMIRISDCDIFIYVGGESDKWVDKALENAKNMDMTVVRLMDVLADNIKEEEIKEGMAAEHDHDEHDNETEYDEHIWLSLNNAQKCVTAIADLFSSADSENSDVYEKNADAYKNNLQLLDGKFHALFDNNPQTLIFGDRFPFRYFVDDYGLSYYAAFMGCSADTEASFETITFLAEKADELNVKTIFAIENSDCNIANAVIDNTSSKNQSAAILDSIQSVTTQQINDGVTYLSIMEKNYDVLKEAFK